MYDGVEEVLKQQNIQRKRALEYKGTEKSQRRRVHLKKLRVQNAQQRKLWSSKHGKDTYGDTDSEKKASKGTKKVCKSCGSDKHSLPTHHLCPNNKSVTHNTLPPDANTEDEESDTSLMSGPYSDLSDEVDADMVDDNAVSGCECGASGRAHKRECPLNPRNCQEAKRGSKTLNAADPVTKSACNEEATRLFREDKMDLDKAESEEESAPPRFRLGDHVHIQVPGKDGQHLLCRIALVTGKRYTLQCKRGTLSQRFGAGELEPRDSSSYPAPAVRNLLYTLSYDDMATVERPNGWLNDKVIQAGQEIMAQQFPTIKGLQSTTLQEVRGFEVHREPFVQILNVSRNYWFVVSTVNCEPGHVRVYDTIHTDTLHNTYTYQTKHKS